MEGLKWSERKERSKANGFVATVIIRLAENHFISHGAEGMLGNGKEAGFQCSEAMMQTDVSVSVYACWHMSALNIALGHV